MTTDQFQQDEAEQRATEWWHRDHPTFTALSGFFAGMLFVTLVPGGFVGLLRLLFAYDTAEELFPLVLLSLIVPIGLLIAPRTRRFGVYMVIGMVLTALVVLGVASVVLYYLVQNDV
jgi:4-amino-4-deoxy-L-arabinose transferase-like glycosyltransferase